MCDGACLVAGKRQINVIAIQGLLNLRSYEEQPVRVRTLLLVMPCAGVDESSGTTASVNMLSIFRASACVFVQEWGNGFLSLVRIVFHSVAFVFSGCVQCAHVMTGLG